MCSASSDRCSMNYCSGELITQRVFAKSHLHRLEEVLTRGISLSIILNGIGREICEPVVWIVGMIEKDFLRRPI